MTDTISAFKKLKGAVVEVARLLADDLFNFLDRVFNWIGELFS